MILERFSKSLASKDFLLGWCKLRYCGGDRPRGGSRWYYRFLVLICVVLECAESILNAGLREVTCDSANLEYSSDFLFCCFWLSFRGLHRHWTLAFSRFATELSTVVAISLAPFALVPFAFAFVSFAALH